jgi:RNase P/RNase MRP subunit p30
MFDLIKCKADAEAHGFSKFYSFEDVKEKIESFKDVVAASQRKNRKILAMLEDYKFDDGAIKLIAEKKKLCFLIDLSRIIKSYRVKRAIEISKLRSFLRLCNKHGAFYAFASFSEKEKEIRSPQELLHISMLFDINKGQAKFALRMIGEYLD